MDLREPVKTGTGTGPWPPVAARGRPSPPVAIRRFHFVFILAGVGFKFQSMLRSILCSFGLDLGSEIVPCWLHLRSILGPFGVFGGVLWRKSSRVGPRAAPGTEPLPILSDFGRILSDFGRKRRPQGVPKWIKNR